MGDVYEPRFGASVGVYGAVGAVGTRWTCVLPDREVYLPADAECTACEYVNNDACGYWPSRIRIIESSIRKYQYRYRAYVWWVLEDSKKLKTKVYYNSNGVLRFRKEDDPSYASSYDAYYIEYRLKLSTLGFLEPYVDVPFRLECPLQLFDLSRCELRAWMMDCAVPGSTNVREALERMCGMGRGEMTKELWRGFSYADMFRVLGEREPAAAAEVVSRWHGMLPLCGDGVRSLFSAYAVEACDLL